MQQREFIREYNDAYRPKFNKSFFIRTDEELIEALHKIILSCQRTGNFTIKVIGWEVINEYDDVNHILWAYEDAIINKNKNKESSKTSSSKKPVAKGNSKNKDNPFAYINLKDSDLKLIKVTYYIDIIEKKAGFVSDTLTVYIAIPTIIDGIYYRINGNIYSAMNQIVDASTYNNSAAKNTKKPTVAFKSFFMATRIYRYQNKLIDINGEPHPCVYFVINAFRKSLLLIKYFLAKFGVEGAMKYLCVYDTFIIKEDMLSRIDPSSNYIFPIKGKDFYITTPKELYDNIQIYQSFVYTLHDILYNTPDYFNYTNIFDADRRVFIETVGLHFTNKDMSIVYNKGLNILTSLDSIYDQITMDDLRLSDDDKGDVFKVLRWLMYEFNALRQKDNLDITTKKVRYAEYIVTYYATKLFLGICRVSDKAERADLDTLRKALLISPMYLINAITKCQLVNYKNSVNDLDSLLALKYTYKGVAGIGESSNAISSAYRSVHPSHLGKVDIDSSSNSDPGTSGTLCPLTTLYDSHFSEYQEPSEWRDKVNSVIDQYRATKSRKSMYKLVNQIKDQPIDDNTNNISDEAISIAYDLVNAIKTINNLNGSFNNEKDYIEFIGNGHIMVNEQEDYIEFGR